MHHKTIRSFDVWIGSMLLALMLASPAFAQTWIQLAPNPTLPKGRLYNSPVYNPATNRMVVFGGYPVHTFGDQNPQNDLWILSGANGIGTPSWTQAIPPFAAGSPSARFGYSAAYDQQTNRMLMFGGWSSGLLLNDLWLLNNADGASGNPTWQRLFPAGAAPSARVSHSAVYDAASNRMIVFGGQATQNCPCSLLNDVWVLTNANGTEALPPAWIHLAPSGTVPTTRSSFLLGYDPTANRLIVFGGVTGSSLNVVLGDQWVLTNANGLGGPSAWQQVTAAGSQPALAFPAGAYDSSTNRLVVFGGLAQTNLGAPSSNATRILMNANGLGGAAEWQQLVIPGQLPIERDSATTSYDPSTNRLIVFSGEQHQSALTLNDTWVLTNANGIAGSNVTVTQVVPHRGGNTGVVTAQVIGSGFQRGAVVALSGAGPDVVASNVNVHTSSNLSATFDLRGVGPGARNLVITNPDLTAAFLQQGFSLELGGQSDVHVSIVGSRFVRPNTAPKYYAVIENRGIVDALAVTASVGQSNLPGSLATAFAGPVRALSSVTVPFPLIPTGSITPPSNCVSATADVRVALESSPCEVLRFAREQVTEVLKHLYINQLSNLVGWIHAIQDRRCFDPADRMSRFYCDGAELAADALGALMEGVEQFQQQLANWELTLGCPPEFGIPDEVDILGTLTLGMHETVSRLKPLFEASTLPADEINSHFTQVALFETQALALPPVLSFPNESGSPPSEMPPTDSSSLPVCTVASLDPNDKSGLTGGGPERYVRGSTPLSYYVHFENQANATAPAQEILVTDQLDPATVNLNTLRLGPISFASHVVSPPPFQAAFHTTVDLRPAQDILVVINAQLNPLSGVLTWSLKSLDPSTGLPPMDPTAGFLPPGGEGSVFFTVMPQQVLTTNTLIQNQASIVFDANDPIITSTWLNTLDNTPPTSHVLALPATENTANFTVQWSGTDDGAGVHDFSVFVSEDGGPFTAFQTNTPETSATFTGQAGRTYAFFSVARDVIGYVEDAKTTPETTTVVIVPADLLPPVIAPVIDIVAEATGADGALVSYVSPATTDDIDPPGIAACTPVSGSQFALGATTATCLAEDAAGNDASASFMVTVRDTTAPAIGPVSDLEVDATGPDGALVVYVSPATTDVVAGPGVGSCLPASGSMFPVGSSFVTCTASDAAGNTSHVGFRVAVVVRDTGDVTPPVLSAPATLKLKTADPGGVAALYTVTATDLVDGPVPVNCAPLSGAMFPVGATTVTCDATDRAGNRATATIMVTVVPSVPPIIAPFSSFTLEAAGPSGAVAHFAPTARDYGDGAVPVECAPASGSTFALGRTTVGCHAVDGEGNRATTSFTVRVIDSTPPTLHLPPAFTMTATDEKGSRLPPFATEAFDLVSGTVPVTCSLGAGARVSIGTTNVVCKARDAGLNTSQGVVTVTVLPPTP